MSSQPPWQCVSDSCVITRPASLHGNMYQIVVSSHVQPAFMAMYQIICPASLHGNVYQIVVTSHVQPASMAMYQIIRPANLYGNVYQIAVLSHVQPTSMAMCQLCYHMFSQPPWPQCISDSCVITCPASLHGNVY